MHSEDSMSANLVCILSEVKKGSVGHRFLVR